MPSPADSELTEDIIELGHCLLSYHRAHTIRKRGFKDLIELFLRKYPIPQPVPTYPPIWLSSTAALQTAIDQFVTTAGHTLTESASVANSNRSPRPPSLPSSETTFEYEIPRRDPNMPDSDGFSQGQADHLTRLLEAMLQQYLQDHPPPVGQQGPPGATGPAGPQGPPGNSIGTSFSPKDIGYFNPKLDEKEGKGDVVQIGSETHIRDVYYFIDRIKDCVRLHDEELVKANIAKCLRGAAMEWYTTTLTSLEKEALRTGHISLWYDTLEKTWKESTADALDHVLSARYTLEDAEACKDIATHIHSVLRHAKPANISDPHAQITLIYHSIHPLLRAFVPVPTADTPLNSFIQACQVQKENWKEIAKHNLPGRRSRFATPPLGPTSQSSQSSARNYRPFRSSFQRFNPRYGQSYGDRFQSDGSGFRQHEATYPRQQETNPQTSRPLQLPTTRQALRITNSPANNRTQEATRTSTSNNSDPRNRPLRPFQSRTYHGDYLDQEHQPYDENTWDNDRIREEMQQVYTEQTTEFQDQIVEDEADIQPEDPLQAGFAHCPNKPRDSICRNCHEAFPSRNQLHSHLRNGCKKRASRRATAATSKNPQSQTTPFNKLPTIESNALFPNDLNKQTFRSWKYATIMASISTDKDPEELCADTGCSPTIADEPYLVQNGVNIQDLNVPVPIRGVGNRIIHAKCYALMDLFIPSHVNGKPAKARLKMRVLVIPCLPAKLLIGSDTLATHGAILNYSDQSFTISTCNLTAPMKVKARNHGSVQRVIRNKNTVVIPAGSVQPVHITMRDQHRLPKDRDYCFWPDRNERLGPGGGTYNRIVDADVYFVHVQNKSEKPVLMAKNTRLGLLTDYNEEGAFAVDTYQHEMAVHGLSLTQPLSSDLTTWTASTSSSSHLNKQNEQPSATSSAASDKQQSNIVAPKLTAGSTDLDATKIHKITMAVTAYGTPEEVHQYDQLIQRHITLFTDDGKLQIFQRINGS